MKKFVTLLLALVMALSLAACGGGKDGLTVEEGKLHMSTNAEFPPDRKSTRLNSSHQQ